MSCSSKGMGGSKGDSVTPPCPAAWESTPLPRAQGGGAGSRLAAGYPWRGLGAAVPQRGRWGAGAPGEVGTSDVLPTLEEHLFPWAGLGRAREAHSWPFAGEPQHAPGSSPGHPWGGGVPVGPHASLAMVTVLQELGWVSFLAVPCQGAAQSASPLTGGDGRSARVPLLQGENEVLCTGRWLHWPGMTLLGACGAAGRPGWLGAVPGVGLICPKDAVARIPGIARANQARGPASQVFCPPHPSSPGASTSCHIGGTRSPWFGVPCPGRVFSAEQVSSPQKLLSIECRPPRSHSWTLPRSGPRWDLVVESSAGC
ncbi:uncharacterized protein LOC115639330 [Gopherus evgoodei]|uniref:uncharacterized protein LOC115639330 n=1 Tax=Gopherus evgoodei TaxID=1825980 RepID=UPI0011CFC617|nr:uncharacterized protein LOC115639330 [Gopherus evgoodei]